MKRGINARSSSATHGRSRSKASHYVQKFSVPEKTILGKPDRNGSWRILNGNEKPMSNHNEKPMHNAYTILYHFSQTSEPLQPKNGNMIQSNTPSWYHTDDAWRYFGRRAKSAVAVNIPTEVLIEYGVPSKFHCGDTNPNGRCFITWVLPPFFSKFIKMNTVRYNFKNGQFANIPRMHVNWVGPMSKNKLTVHSRTVGNKTFHYVGESP